MSSFRLLLCVVLVVLLAVFVGAPFYMSAPSVEGVVASDDPAMASAQATGGAIPPARPPIRDTRPLGPRVRLVEPVIFPVNDRGRLLGHVRAKQGTTVDLLAENGSEVVIRLVNSSVRVPRRAVAALDPAEAEESLPFAENVRAAGQRIIEYWLPGRTRDLSAQP